MRGLVTPATYTVTVNSPGFTTQTPRWSLADGQKLTGVQLTLARSAGSLSGTVTTMPATRRPPGWPHGDRRATSVGTTITQSAGTVGGWTMAGLPIPGTYTVTFSRADLQPQTVAVNLDPAGNPTSGSAGAGAGGTTSTVAMTSAFAEISGVVSQRSSGRQHRSRRGGAVNLTSGSDTYTVTSASRTGVGGRLLPGRRGVARHLHPVGEPPRHQPDQRDRDRRRRSVARPEPVLIPPASITGLVRDRQGSPQPGSRSTCSRRRSIPRRSPSGPPPTRPAGTRSPTSTRRRRTCWRCAAPRGRHRVGDHRARRQPGAPTYRSPSAPNPR